MELLEKFQELESKQKVTLGVTVVLFIFVLYYGYSTFFSGPSYPSAPPAPAPTVAKETQTTTTSVPPPAQSTTTRASASPTQEAAPQIQNGATGATVRDGVEEVPSREPDPEQLAMLKESEEVQQEYLELVNKYQLIQLQQKVAQAENGLATSKLESAQIQSQTQEISNQLQSSSMSQATLAQQDQAKHKSAFQSLTVMYVAKQQGRWTAMLSASGNYFEVKVGTRLPDGSVVSRIDEHGVVLTRDGVRRPITIAKTLN